MTAYDTLFSTFGSSFETALNLPANFFLQQNQGVPANLALSGSSQPYGRLWIDSLGSDCIVGETISPLSATTVLSTLQAPQEFDLIVHFYRKTARDLAVQLAVQCWGQIITDALNAINLTIITTSNVQNTPEIHQQAWSDHAMIKLSCSFIATETQILPALATVGPVGITWQDPSGSTIGVTLHG